MKVKDIINKFNPENFYILDTTQDGLSNVIVHGAGDINYTRYCYSTTRYAKLKEGGMFLYRQTKRSSKNRKFYFFGGGIIEKIISVDNVGGVEAIISNGFALVSPVFEDDARFDTMTWTSKNKQPKSWDHFWNQYGMNQISEDEFLAIAGNEECIYVKANDDASGIDSILEEKEILEKVAKKPDEFKGTYTKSGAVDYTTKEPTSRKSSPKKIDYDTLNKTKKTRGTFGEILVFNDEVDRLSDLGINKPVDHVAITEGDGLGYDISSYDENGNEIFIEVKTTTVNKVDGFYLTEKEIKVCQDKKKQFKLYRVYNLNMNAGTYNVEIFDGEELMDLFKFQPVSYIAKRK